MHEKILLYCRLSLFIVYFWFGALKILGVSPAKELVLEVFNNTLVLFNIPFSYFYVSFAIFECILGFLFLIKGMEKVAFYLMVFHIFATMLPLVLLPELTWTGFLSLTLSGQYIVKNLLIIAVGLVLYESSLIETSTRDGCS